MPQAGLYRVSVRGKEDGRFYGIYPVTSDGINAPEGLALAAAVDDGHFKDLQEAHEKAQCTIVGEAAH